MNKIDCKILGEFLNKVTLNRKIDSLAMNFGPIGVEIRAKDIASTIIISGLLKKEIFKEYEAIGVVGLYNTEILSKILKKSSGR